MTPEQGTRRTAAEILHCLRSCLWQSRVRWAFVVILLLPVLPAAAQRADADLPAAPAQYFLDAVGLVTPDEAQQFADALYAFEQRTKIRFVVAVLPDHSGELQDYTSRLYEHWRIGQRDTRRGVLFVVFPDRRESRIETGGGMEETLPDVVASRILRNMVDVPREPAAGRLAFVVRSVVAAVAPDDPLAPSTSTQGDSESGEGQAAQRRIGITRRLPLLGGGLVLLFIVVAIARAANRSKMSGGASAHLHDLARGSEMRDGVLCPFSWIRALQPAGCIAGIFGGKPTAVTKPQPCIGSKCQLWNAEHNDCGLVSTDPHI